MKRWEFFVEDLDEELDGDMYDLHRLLTKVISECCNIRDIEKNHGEHCSRYDSEELLKAAIEMRDRVYDWGRMESDNYEEE